MRTAPSRRRDRPKQVDALGEHDQRCPRSFTLVRHDHVQDTVRGELRYGGKNAKPATVHELRSRDMRDTSMTKGDLRATNMSTDGLPTVIDFGITHSLLDTYIRAIKSKVERGYGADRYDQKKVRHYHKIMDEKDLHGHLHYRSFTLGTFGSFGKSAWKIIDEVCDSDHPHALDDFNSWRDPDPRRRFILSVGFALQRGNSRMLRQADRRRSGTRYRGRRSGVDVARAA